MTLHGFAHGLQIATLCLIFVVLYFHIKTFKIHTRMIADMREHNTTMHDILSDRISNAVEGAINAYDLSIQNEQSICDLHAMCKNLEKSNEY